MKNLKKKLQSNKGETLVEALASVLIIAIVAAALAYAVIVAVNISKTAEAADKKFKNSVSEVAEPEDKVGSGTITIGGKNATVDFYGDSNGEIFTFRLQTAGGGE